MALTTAFAKNGNRKAVPQTTQDGSVSYDQGFGNLYALPPEEGGLFIDRAQFNQIMYDTTSAVISNQNSINTLNSKVTANTNSINTLNSKVANIESNVSTGVVNLTGNQTIAGVKTFSSPPVSATNPTANNQVANKAYVDTVGNTAVKLTGNQTIAGVKTFSSPVVVPDATATTHAVNLAQLNTKANWNAVVNLTDNQSIAGAKTFTSNITAPNITAMQNNLNKIFSATTNPVRIQTTTQLITVGTGSDFQKIEPAIFAALRFTTPVEIRLTSDISMTGDINITNVSGHHIKINFNNFKLINSNLTAGNAFRLYNSSIGIIEKLNLIGYELNLANNASTILKGDVTIKSENRVGVRAINLANGSKLATNSNITYTTQSYGALTPFFCEDGSILAFGNKASINDTSTSGTLFVVASGGIISTINATIQTTCTAKANQAANTPTKNGIIFGNYSL